MGCQTDSAECALVVSGFRSITVSAQLRIAGTVDLNAAVVSVTPEGSIVCNRFVYLSARNSSRGVVQVHGSVKAPSVSLLSDGHVEVSVTGRINASDSVLNNDDVPAAGGGSHCGHGGGSAHGAPFSFGGWDDHSLSLMMMMIVAVLLSPSASPMPFLILHFRRAIAGVPYLWHLPPFCLPSRLLSVCAGSRQIFLSACFPEPPVDSRWRQASSHLKRHIDDRYYMRYLLED